MARKVYQTLASRIGAFHNCVKANNSDWIATHEEAIEHVAKEYLPSGSGFNSGTKVDIDKSTGNRLVLVTSYHHMNENGYYDGWTEHTIIVKPDLSLDFTLTITGKDKNGIKEYIADQFNWALSADCKID